MKNLQQFVTNNAIPEFVKTNHELFETFVAAYYEWLELQKTETSASLLELYKNVGNPAFIANHQEKLVDIDESIESFVDFFANEIVPISLEGMQSDPKFFIKKARDMYLAKGTTNSFKLFFRLYFNKDIEVFESADTILRSSDGKWFSFPTAYFYVEEFQDEVANFDFTLSTINADDSDRKEIAVVLTGQLIEKTNSGELVIKVQFSTDTVLEKETSYYFVQSDKKKLIKVRPFVSISEINVVYPGSLYNEKDSVRIESTSLDKKFSASVGAVTKGFVKGLKVRDKGVYYSTNDKFIFTDGVTFNGIFRPTKVGNYGQIEQIENFDLRTGPENTGFLANNLEDVFIPLNSSNQWSELPYIEYQKGATSFSGIGEPYLKSSVGGEGFQVLAISDTIGKAQSISLSQESFFRDSDDVFMNVPSTLIVEACDLEEGSIVSFQKFKETASYGPFQDDSEYFQQTFQVFRIWEHRNDGSGLDSEVVRKDFITVPHSWDSEKFDWVVASVEIDTDTDSELGIWQPVIDFFNQNSNLSFKYFVDSEKETDVDGGDGYGSIPIDSEISGTVYDDGFIDPENLEAVDGGDLFSFSRSKINSITFEFKGKTLSQLETYHFEKLNSLVGMDSEINRFSWRRFKEEIRLVGKEDSEFVNSISNLDAGYWENMGYYGEVVSVDHHNQVAKIVSYEQSPLPTQEQIDSASGDKYSVIKLSKRQPDGTYENNFSLPLKNIVHQIDRMTVNYKTAVVSDLYKKFWTQDGFLSSSYGGTLRDNYFYTNWSYRIKTEIPFQEWKQKFKTMLHPAGLVLSAELTENMQVSGLLLNSFIETDANLNPRMTFDLQQEYIDLEPTGVAVNADNTLYKSNSFEALTADGTDSISLESSRQSNLPGISERQQSGNAFWDYEPIGWVKKTLTVGSENYGTGTDPRGLVIRNGLGYVEKYDSEYWFEYQGNLYERWRWYVYDFGTNVTELRERLNVDSDLFFLSRKTTQDSDNNGNVANTYKFFQLYDGSRQDLYKTTSRSFDTTPLICKVQLADSAITNYPVFDSDLPTDFVSVFGDSDAIFKSIDYTRLRSDSDTRYFQQFRTNRASEIALLKERDLREAMKENGSLVFEDSEVQYTDYEAFERKWNKVNSQRTINDEGYVVKGDMVWAGYSHIDQRNSRRSLRFYKDRTYTKHSPVNSPLSQTIWEGGTIVWNRSYYDQVNKVFVEDEKTTNSYRDPQVSMRNRRGR